MEYKLWDEMINDPVINRVYSGAPHLDTISRLKVYIDNERARSLLIIKTDDEYRNVIIHRARFIALGDVLKELERGK